VSFVFVYIVLFIVVVYVLCCSQCRAHVLVTDLPEFVGLMRSNVELNSHVITGRVGAEELTW